MAAPLGQRCDLAGPAARERAGADPGWHRCYWSRSPQGDEPGVR